MRRGLITFLLILGILAFGGVALWDIDRRIEKHCGIACAKMKEDNEKRRCQEGIYGPIDK